MKTVEQNRGRENDQAAARPPFRRGKRISTPTDMSTKEMRIAGILTKKEMPSEKEALPVEPPTADVGKEKGPLLKDRNAVLSEENVNDWDCNPS